MYIEHVAIWTADLEKMKNFYLNYFLCSANQKYENIEKYYSSYFLTFDSGSRMELMNRKDIAGLGQENRLGITHIAITVGTREKVDQLTQKLAMDGFTVYSQPRTTGDGYYESVVLDPENNKIELTATDDFVITHAKSGDLEKILYLQKCCYLSEAEIYNDYTISPISQTLQDIQQDFGNQLILKLVFQHQIIGSVRGYMHDNTCYIGKLFVENGFQKMGLGQKLLKSIEDKFPMASRFELFTGFKSEKNITFYKKSGYSCITDERRNDPIHIFLEKYRAYNNKSSNDNCS